jgi:hypothetical protein
MPEWRGVWVSAIAGLVFVAVPIWFLIRQRAAFAGGGCGRPESL